VPKLNKWQYYRLILDEFSDTAELFEGLVCDYFVQSKTVTGMEILACAAEKAQIESYISTFSEAGITLKGIRIGVQAIMNYVNETPALKEKTFILNVVDGVTMLSMIFNKGVNVFSSRLRLYSEETEQLVGEMLANLSGLIQFTKSEKLSDIEHCYYLGINGEQLELINETTHYPDIKYDILNIYDSAAGTEKLCVDSHFVFLNTLLSNDSIDLMRSVKSLAKLKKKQKPKRFWIPAFIGILVLLIAPFTYFTLQASNVYDKIAEAHSFLMDEEVSAKSVLLDRTMLDISLYGSIRSQAESKMQYDETMIVITNDALDLITGSFAGISISSFSFSSDTGVLRAECISPDERTAANYIEFLKGSPLIQSARYVGYSYSLEDGVRRYAFSVDVTLASKESTQ
jgi:hypothetical protein